MRSHPKKVVFAVMGFYSNNQVPQTLTIEQLTEHQDEKLVPTLERLDEFVAMIFAAHSR